MIYSLAGVEPNTDVAGLFAPKAPVFPKAVLVVEVDGWPKILVPELAVLLAWPNALGVLPNVPVPPENAPKPVDGLF